MEIWRYSTGNLWCWDFGDKLVAEGEMVENATG